jgi:hypothetical protein
LSAALVFGHFGCGTNIKPEVDVDRRAAAKQISPGASMKPDLSTGVFSGTFENGFWRFQSEFGNKAPRPAFVLEAWCEVRAPDSSSTKVSYLLAERRN